MRPKLYLSILLLSILSFPVYSQLSRGCLAEPRDTSLIHHRVFSRETYGNLPSSYSLKQLAPDPLSQGSLSSCTAWSSAYCGMTIVKRLEENNFSSEPFSPLHLYNRLKAITSEDPCRAGGCYVSDALNMLEDHGCAKFSEIANICGYASASGNFQHKLHGFDELEVNANSIKSALVKNAPVVFVIQYYTDGWGETKNLKNGIWNGYYSGPDGYHAMTIIGYDDNVGNGGAFQVQNSWGEDWGDKGLFWLQYKDIKHIDQAFMLMGDPEKLKKTNFNGNSTTNNGTNYTNNNTNNGTNTNDGDTDDNGRNQTTDNDPNVYNGRNKRDYDQVFRVYNECSVTAYVALAQYKDGEWINKGWYATQPDKYIELNIGDRDADDIYWLAINNTNNLVWKDSENGTDMCYDPTDAFTIYDNKEPSCPKYTKFFKESPGFEYEVYTQTLTCPSLRSRDLNNNSTTLSTNVLDHKHDDRDPTVANFNWKQGYMLFDLYSKDIIHATTDKRGNAVYHIWYVDTDNKINEATLSEERLANLEAYKFISRENAERWLSSRR